MPELEQASMEMMDVVYLKGRDADKSLNVTFSMEPHHNTEKSAREGRPIYDDREYVKIQVPGDKDSVVERPVTEIDRRRFADKYAAFKAGRSQELSGTPLTAVAWMSKSRVRELEYFGVRTLEQLANMSDEAAQKFMGINLLRSYARDHIAAAAEAAPLVSMRTELEAKENEISALKHAVAEQAQAMQALQQQMHAFMAQSGATQGVMSGMPPAIVPQQIQEAPPIVAPRPMARVPGSKGADSK